MKQCVESGPIPVMEEQRYTNILSLVPSHLQESKYMQETIQELFTEVQGDFHSSMMKSMSEYIRKDSHIKGIF